MATGITFGGLASGLDTNSIIDKLVSVERQPIVRLQQQKQNESAKKTLIGDLMTKLETLSTSVTSLSTSAGVQGRTVDVPSTAPFSATVSGGAPTGTYSIQVNQLARAQRTYSRTQASSTATGVFTPGTVTISIGATSANISLTAADSLSTAADKINASGLRLSAAVVYDGANYRMVVNGIDTGSANAITFSDPSNTGLGLHDVGATVVTAQNASLTVDGLTVTSTTNTLSNTLPGVTLTLKGTAASPSVLTVGQDQDKLKTSLTSIVEAFNAAMSIVNKQVGGDSRATETLAGDSSVKQLQTTLFAIPTVRGGPAGNTFTTLTEIGVSVDRYGTMSLDENRLRTALARDANAITNLLAGTDGTNGAMKKIADGLKLYTSFVDGVLPTKQKTIDSRIKTIDDDIARMEAAATTYEQNLRQQFIQMEQLIASFQSQTGALQAQLGQTNTNNGR